MSWVPDLSSMVLSVAVDLQIDPYFKSFMILIVYL